MAKFMLWTLKDTSGWAYNSFPGSLNIDYPNINSSIALGNSGLAVGTSTGDIFCI